MLRVLGLEEEIMQVLDECLACGNDRLEEVVDLGDQPLANSFTDLPNEILERFPLRLNFCSVCTHLQLSHCVNRNEIFDEYIYVSGTTETLRQDFRSFALEMTEKHGVGRVLDIACNDGSQLDAFAELGWQTIGIDPAKNLFEISSKKHEVHCEYLSEKHVGLGEFDLVVAQNVLAHTDDPLGFLRIASKLGNNIYVQTSQAMMIFDNQFDTIYHEHLSFFSENSMRALSERAGLVLSGVSIRKIHGGSFLFHITKSGLQIEPTNIVTNEVVKAFTVKTKRILLELTLAIESISKEGIPIVGYGAAAKGMTVLNSSGAILDVIIDDSSFKQGKYAPGSGTLVAPIDKLLDMPETICLIPLAWNFADEILSRVKNVYHGEVRLLRYFPEVELS
jgi:SAM-dependent methyltransferase